MFLLLGLFVFLMYVFCVFLCFWAHGKMFLWLCVFCIFLFSVYVCVLFFFVSREERGDPCFFCLFFCGVGRTMRARWGEVLEAGEVRLKPVF